MSDDGHPGNCPECGAYLKPVVCPECGGRMVLKRTRKFLYNNGQPRKFYGCTSFPACKGTHGADLYGRPLGIPANLATKRARQRAHEVFDKYWADKGLTRSQGYELLQQIMNLPKDKAHIANFDETQCELLIAYIANEEDRSCDPSEDAEARVVDPFDDPEGHS